MASLFDKKLDEVPNFITYAHEALMVRIKWIRLMGYDFHGQVTNYRQLGMSGENVLTEMMQEAEGINGFFYASVYSPKYFTIENLVAGNIVTHAVIIDKEFNIVHDPNPGNVGLKEYPLHRNLGYNGILSFEVYKRR